MIILSGIKKLYRMGAEEVPVLQGVDLEIKAGEFVAIMGPSGSGKSTLMNIIGCLDVPTEGIYSIDGQEVQKLDEEQLAGIRNRKIGFVFQNFNLLPRQTVLRNVMLPLMYGGVAMPERSERAAELLRKVGLGERLKHKPNELSGGQRQRVAIARALAMNPPIVLADEPTGNLDTRTSLEIMELFTELNREGTTIILVTHEPDIARYADRVVRFGDGRIVEDYRNGEGANRESV